jgi:hypothetical protein
MGNVYHCNGEHETFLLQWRLRAARFDKSSDTVATAIAVSRQNHGCGGLRWPVGPIRHPDAAGRVVGGKQM